jgi:hypothetical protein
MGGSLLRAMAFGKPCVVQGEHGFFRTLDLDSAREFRWRGFYGLGDGGRGEDQLVGQLDALLEDPDLRRRNAAVALALVRRHYSLDKAVDQQIAWYRSVLRRNPVYPNRVEVARTAAAIGGWFGGRVVTRPTGPEKTDYFNSPTRIEPGMRNPVPAWYDPELDDLITDVPAGRPDDLPREPSPIGGRRAG